MERQENNGNKKMQLVLDFEIRAHPDKTEAA
jgi:hypothetical protein